jgi:hypothetical protein
MEPVSTPTDLADRYGQPAAWRRPALISFSVVLGIVFVGFVLWAAVFHSTPAIQSETTRFDVKDEHSVDVQLHVQMNDAKDPQCLVRAMSEDKTIVGELTFTPIAGEQAVTVRTDRRATSAEAIGCRTSDQPRWR